MQPGGASKRGKVNNGYGGEGGVQNPNPLPSSPVLRAHCPVLSGKETMRDRVGFLVCVKGQAVEWSLLDLRAVGPQPRVATAVGRRHWGGVSGVSVGHQVISGLEGWCELKAKETLVFF